MNNNKKKKKLIYIFQEGFQTHKSYKHNISHLADRNFKRNTHYTPYFSSFSTINSPVFYSDNERQLSVAFVCCHIFFIFFFFSYFKYSTTNSTPTIVHSVTHQSKFVTKKKKKSENTTR